jgi:hypothetical protein
MKTKKVECIDYLAIIPDLKVTRDRESLDKMYADLRDMSKKYNIQFITSWGKLL